MMLQETSDSLAFQTFGNINKKILIISVNMCIKKDKY